MIVRPAISTADVAALAREPAPRWDRWVWLAMLITTLVVVPRTIFILRVHSEYMDDQAHIKRGLSFVTGNPANMFLMMNDPPLGDAIIVLPMVVTGCLPSHPIDWKNWPGGKPEVESQASEHVAFQMRATRAEILFGYHLSPETILMMIGIWKAILFVPFAGLVFHWCRALYGLTSAWLALGMLLVEPTFAAHIPPAALDVMAVEAIVAALYFAWRYLENPSRGRLIVMAIWIAVALLIKHTAIILPGVILIYAAMQWVVRPWLNREPLEKWKGQFRGRLDAVLLAAVIVCLTIWALTLFDFSEPRRYCWPVAYHKNGQFSFFRDVLDPLFDLRWPGGIYVGSLIGGVSHSMLGHWSFLLGEHSEHGWWYYFPVVATYKIPIGIGVVMLLGLVSIWWVRPKWEELALFVPMVAWMGLMMTSSIDIGFRHFLPIYIFILMLASRCVSGRGAGTGVLLFFSWAGVAATFLHSLTYHPDYIAYMNYGRHKPWLEINDSNVDWGQGLKQVREWLAEHPQDGRPVYLAYFGSEKHPGIRYYLGDQVISLSRTQERPTSGLLIASPAAEASICDYYDAYGALRSVEPIALIGHSMLVYDLDAMHRRGFKWPPTTREVGQWLQTNPAN